MNVLFILGNGFDKAQGLETSYHEFYDDYIRIKASSSLEESLKRDIKSNYNTWADLEEGLGTYSASFSDVNLFREVLHILNSRLKNYLKIQTSKVSSLGLSKQKFLDSLLHPESGLEPKQISEYESFLASHGKEPVFINCVTFNYTDTIEKVLGNTNASLGFTGNHSEVFMKQFLHLHGSLDSMIIVGVNDVGQIANEGFRNVDELIEEFVKPDINAGCENMKNEVFTRMITDAHVIVLFGVSVGITDSKWWHEIGLRLDNPLDPLLLIYYPYDPKKDTDAFPFRKLRWSKDYISFLKERMNIHASIDDLRDRILVGINKPYMRLV